MNSLNKHIICGRLGKDPEYRELAGDKKVCTFSIATSEVWKDDKGEKKEKTEWHNVVAWGKQAEIVSKYVHKGDLLYLEGKVTSRSYDDKEGIKKYVHETVMSDFMLMPNKKDAAAPAPAAKAAPTAKPKEDFTGPINDSDDLPF